MNRAFLLLSLALALPGCQTSTPTSEPSSASPHASAAPSASAAHSATPAPGPPFVSNERFDVLIAGATVVDGTGARPFVGDVLVGGGRIAHVGRVSPKVRVERRIDAKGLVVAPGFIDAHSHGDPLGENQYLVAQGVTTMVVGQDGISATKDRMALWAALVEKRKLPLNVVPLVGHATVRTRSNVGARTDPSPEQIARMARIVEQELAAGAWGLSTGLEYVPGRFAGASELAALAEPVARADGIVMSHMRSEDEDAIDAALDELVAQGERSGARVHVSHVKIVHAKGTPPADKLLARMAAARKRGVRLTADIYPYTASYTTIGIVFPDYAKPPNSYDKVKRTRREELAGYLRERVAKRGGPAATLFGSPPHRGKTLADVAAHKNQPFEEFLIDLGPMGGSAAFFVMDEATQTRLLLDAHVMIGADGGQGSGHPRAYGTFARVLRHYVVKEKLLSIEEAVRKMSGLTAETLGLARKQRGLLKSGWAADLVVFDPKDIEDRADYTHPNRLARGMRWVWINGHAVVDEGKYDGRVKGGRLLLR